jgi:hypothetical protein
LGDHIEVTVDEKSDADEECRGELEKGRFCRSFQRIKFFDIAGKIPTDQRTGEKFGRDWPDFDDWL